MNSHAHIQQVTEVSSGRPNSSESLWQNYFHQKQAHCRQRAVARLLRSCYSETQSW